MMADSWRNLKDTITFSSFFVCYNRNRSALVRVLLGNKSLFVGQLKVDKSLALQTVIYYSTNLC